MSSRFLLIDLQAVSILDGGFSSLPKDLIDFRLLSYSCVLLWLRLAKPDCRLVALTDCGQRKLWMVQIKYDVIKSWKLVVI